MTKPLHAAAMLTFALWVAQLAAAQAPAAAKPDNKNSPAQTDMAQRYKEFEQTLSGARLVGQFTVLGRDQAPLSKEEYTISSVSKLPEGDYWSINARIKYGELDVTVPLKLEVKWAGDTPVITLTDLIIPVLGTFSSRVVIYNKKYAGTWTHGEVGGHLFGTIEKLAKEEGEPDK